MLFRSIDNDIEGDHHLPDKKEGVDLSQEILISSIIIGLQNIIVMKIGTEGIEKEADITHHRDHLLHLPKTPGDEKETTKGNLLVRERGDIIHLHLRRDPKRAAVLIVDDSNMIINRLSKKKNSIFVVLTHHTFALSVHKMLPA